MNEFVLVKLVYGEEKAREEYEKENKEYVCCSYFVYNESSQELKFNIM